MQMVMNGYQGFSVLLGLNWDKFFSIGRIVVGLMAGAYMGNVILNP